MSAVLKSERSTEIPYRDGVRGWLEKVDAKGEAQKIQFKAFLAGHGHTRDTEHG